MRKEYCQDVSDCRKRDDHAYNLHAVIGEHQSALRRTGSDDTHPFSTNTPQPSKVQRSGYSPAANDLCLVDDCVVGDVDEHVHQRHGEHGERSCSLHGPHRVAHLSQSIVRVRVPNEAPGTNRFQS